MAFITFETPRLSARLPPRGFVASDLCMPWVPRPPRHPCVAERRLLLTYLLTYLLTPPTDGSPSQYPDAGQVSIVNVTLMTILERVEAGV